MLPMNPSPSWIDPNRLGAALARAGVGRAPAPAFATPVRRESEAALPAKAAAAQVEPTRLEPARAPAPDLELTLEFRHDQLEMRLATLVDWLRQVARSSALFIADRDGLILLEENIDSALAAFGTSLLKHDQQVAHSLGLDRSHPLTVALPDGSVLMLFRAETELGGHGLGVVVPAVPAAALTDRIGAGLHAAFRGPGHDEITVRLTREGGT
jgi:catechol 2,3-dioxygenase-like lactoylglutathione lyase family enzyme